MTGTIQHSTWFTTLRYLSIIMALAFLFGCAENSQPYRYQSEEQPISSSSSSSTEGSDLRIVLLVCLILTGPLFVLFIVVRILNKNLKGPSADEFELAKKMNRELEDKKAMTNV